MITTEDSAKRKVCHVTLARPDATGLMSSGGPSACLGAACMAWHWIDRDPADAKDKPKRLGTCARALPGVEFHPEALK